MPPHRPPNNEDLERWLQLEAGWDKELKRQREERGEPEPEKPERNPQDEDNCAPKAAKVLFLLFVVGSQLYQIIT